MKENKKVIKLFLWGILIIAVLGIGFYTYLSNQEEVLNIDTIMIPEYDFDTYTILTRNNKVFVIDELGNVLNEYDFENEIYTNDIVKRYDSDKLWFKATNHDETASKYDIFGYYDLETKNIEYKEYIWDKYSEGNLTIESEIFLDTTIEGRYKAYSVEDGIYLYDKKLNRGVTIENYVNGKPKFIPNTDTTGYFIDTYPRYIYYIDFENEEVLYTDELRFEGTKQTIRNIAGVYDDKLIVGTWDEDFLLIDEKLDVTKFVDNIINVNGDIPPTGILCKMYYVDENTIMVTHELSEGGTIEWRAFAVSYIDLNTLEHKKIDTIKNNGENYFDILYADDENVYIYSITKEDEYKFIVLDKETLEVVKEIPSKKEWINELYGYTPYIIKN